MPKLALDVIVGLILALATTVVARWIATTWSTALSGRDFSELRVVWLVMLALGAVTAVALLSDRISSAAAGVTGLTLLLYHSAVAVPIFGTTVFRSLNVFPFASIPAIYVLSGAYMAKAVIGAARWRRADRPST